METKEAPRLFLLALLGLVLAVAGPVAAFSFIDNPWLRSSLFFGFVGIGLGIVLGILAWRDRRWFVRVLATGPLFVGALWCALWFVGLKLPGAAGTEILQAAPEFTLPDPQGKPVNLAAARANGPVLLVFYRGHW
jgi:hypothetical protein